MIPRWLSLFVVVVFGYLIVTQMHPSSPTPETVVPAEPVVEQSYPQLAQATDPEHWKRGINPDYAQKSHCEMPEAAKGELTLKVLDDTLGEGEPAHCAETIHVTLTVWNNQGEALYMGTIPITLGARDIAGGLDAGLVGLEPGGTRTLVLPPSALVHGKKSVAPKALLAALKTGNTIIVTATRAAK